MGASEAGEGELDAVAGGAVSPVKSDGEAERSRVEDEDEPSAKELAAQRRREEEERPLTEEELAQINAASNVQAVFRGHRARRAALFTPLWVPYPVPLNALQWGYEDPPAVAQPAALAGDHPQPLRRVRGGHWARIRSPWLWLPGFLL